MNPYLLFDAGGTIIFPNVEYLSNIMKEYGIDVSENYVLKKTCEVGYLVDVQLSKSDELMWSEGFLPTFLEMMLKDVVDSKKILSLIIEKITSEDKRKSLWTYTFDWVKEALFELKNKGYKMSVISNSDGRVEGILKEVGLRAFMDKVYDSHVVGITKPDKRIFTQALDELSISPTESVYVGDMFHIDVLGANMAGIPAIHLDPFNLYDKWKGFRIGSVRELPGVLKKNLKSEEFFPFKVRR